MTLAITPELRAKLTALGIENPDALPRRHYGVSTSNSGCQRVLEHGALGDLVTNAIGAELRDVGFMPERVVWIPAEMSHNGFAHWEIYDLGIRVVAYTADHSWTSYRSLLALKRLAREFAQEWVQS